MPGIYVGNNENVKLKKVAFSQTLKRKNFLKSQVKLRRRNFLLQKKGKIKKIENSDKQCLPIRNMIL